jgi:oxygen-independent coproporphyrinogen-3 oxidase
MAQEVERFFGAVDPDRIADEYLDVCARLAAAGYRHYEVSNFAQPGFESRHNRVYWDGGDYLGVGPAAHSAIGGRRFWNQPSLEAYLARTGPEHLAARAHDAGGDERVERTMLSLRTDRGAPREWLSGDAAIEDFVRDGLAREHDGRLYLTDRGYLVLNDVVLRLTGSTPC